MEPIILMTPNQLRVIIDEAIAPIQAQLDQLLSGRTRSKMLSTIEAGRLVGKTNTTICRWCRGIKVNGEKITLDRKRLPSGKYLIDEDDLLAFATKVTASYKEEEAPVIESAWALTKQRRRREND